MASNTSTRENMTTFLDISSHSLLLLQGPDANKFLQGQVTCDVARLVISDNASKTTLGAHCTHKGRMLFSFLACQLDEQTIALSIHAPLLADALAQLKKYSIFSKVEIIDASDSYRIVGIKGDDTSALRALGLSAPNNIGEASHHSSGVIVIKVSSERFECWLPTEEAQQISAFSALAAGDDAWCLDNINEGIAEVRSETVEAFIPQMFNYQVLREAISFEKGCYTGQEVVARMQYLGKLKKRLYRFSTETTTLLVPNTPLYTLDKKQAIGHVALSAPTNNGQALLAVVNVEPVENDQVFIDAACAQKLKVESLPYSITQE